MHSPDNPQQAFRYATGLAARFGALVELLHVVQDPYISELAADAGRRLETMKSAAEDTVRINVVVLRGQPASTIIDHATAGRFDLIVVGTHGRTGLAHVFMGSVAERVVRGAPCPVVTLRNMLAEGSSTATKAVA